MKIETLLKANKIAKELDRWNDMATRLACGDSFFHIEFRAEENKTMSSKYDYRIMDTDTVDCFKKFVNSMIEKCENEIEKM